MEMKWKLKYYKKHLICDFPIDKNVYILRMLKNITPLYFTQERNIMDDEKIIELFFRRLEQAIDETAKKYGRYLRTISYNILYNIEDSEECVNDTYMRVWNTIPPERPRIFPAYIGTIARNLSLDRYKARRADKRGGGELTLALDELLDCIPTGDFATELIDDMELSQVFDGFLSGLKKESRIIFMRRYWYLSPVKDIARDLGVGESKIKMSLSRTREKLKEYLEKEGIEL